jgi:hypothetical protein
MESRSSRNSDLLFRLCGLVLLVVAFAIFVHNRQRYIGACDWFGYFELGRLFGQGKLFLETPVPVEAYPSIVPLGFVAAGSHALPQYPPGYPLLLGVASWFGAELYVTQLVGACSIILIYLAAREFARRWIALAVASAWAFCPIVMFGSTDVMSDLVATVPLIGSYLLYRRSWLRTSALVLGLSFWVRPTNALYAVVFAGVLLRDRQFYRYVRWTIPTVAVYAVYNHFLYGALWRTGYGSIFHDLSPEVFQPHLGFYLWQTLLHIGPLTPFVFIGLLRGRRSEIAFLATWFASYLLFYCFWLSGGDVWWWIRFLLPAYPALFLLAANGLERTAECIDRRSETANVRRAAFAALAGLVAITVFGHIKLGQSSSHNGLWATDKGRDYVQVVREADLFIPAGAYVGSVEFCGTFRLYSRAQPFLSTHANAPELARDLIARQVPVYLIVEPWNAPDPNIHAMLENNASELVREINLWGGLKVFRLTARPSLN